jgi:hypothetical protein
MKELSIVILIVISQTAFAQSLSIKEIITLVQCEVASDKDSCFQLADKFVEQKGFQFSDPVGNDGYFYSGGKGKGVVLHRRSSYIEYETFFENEYLEFMEQLKQEKFELSASQNTYTSPLYPGIKILEGKLIFSGNEIKYDIQVVR